MAAPKKKRSLARRRTRHTIQAKMSFKSTTYCLKCGTLKLNHHFCLCSKS